MSVKSPLISIITVSYNAIEEIENAIKGIFNQTFIDYEFIIIDGGSTDGTTDILKLYSDRITYWVSEPDHGIYDAMNKAILKAKGQYIYFIGADDVFIDAAVLEKVSHYLVDSEKVYYGDVRFKKRDMIYDGKFNAIKLVTRNISHQSIFYPAGIFDTFTFNTEYKIFADYDLNLRLYNHPVYSFEYIPLTVALFNDEGASGSNTQDLRFEADRLKIIKSHFPYWVYLYRLFRTKLSKLK